MIPTNFTSQLIEGRLKGFNVAKMAKAYARNPGATFSFVQKQGEPNHIESVKMTYGKKGEKSITIQLANLDIKKSRSFLTRLFQKIKAGLSPEKHGNLKQKIGELAKAIQKAADKAEKPQVQVNTPIQEKPKTSTTQKTTEPTKKVEREIEEVNLKEGDKIISKWQPIEPELGKKLEKAFWDFQSLTYNISLEYLLPTEPEIDNSHKIIKKSFQINNMTVLKSQLNGQVKKINSSIEYLTKLIERIQSFRLIVKELTASIKDLESRPKLKHNLNQIELDLKSVTELASSYLFGLGILLQDYQTFEVKSSEEVTKKIDWIESKISKIRNIIKSSTDDLNRLRNNSSDLVKESHDLIKGKEL